MNTDKIAEIIAANTHPDPMAPTNTGLSTYISHHLIDALADHLEAEAGNECGARGCDEEGHLAACGFNRAKFLRIARGNHEQL